MKLERLKKELEEENEELEEYEVFEEIEEGEEEEEEDYGLEAKQEYDDEIKHQLKKMNPLHRQILEDTTLPDYTKFKISENVQMKEYDPNGVLISQGFKPNQKIEAPV